jgi:hypothetical protein
MHEWIYGRGKGLPKDDKRNSIEVYRRHNKDVLNYFKQREQDLLVLDFSKGDGWEKLCNFLHKEIPNVPFPHANKRVVAINNKRNIFKELKREKQRVKYWLQIKYLRLAGYLLNVNYLFYIS